MSHIRTNINFDKLESVPWTDLITEKHLFVYLQSYLLTHIFTGVHMLVQLSIGDFSAQLKCVECR